MTATVPIELQEVPPSFRPFAAAILDHPDPEAGLVALLGTLGEKAPPSEAQDFALLLRRHLPRSARLERVSDIYLRPRFPAWYIRAVNDRHRNAAYRRAIEALVAPGTLVLEAGTGSGLFAMMAARAGAEQVHTCESDPQIARIARENIARNGLADRITLHEGRYEDLAVGTHLPRPADLFLHEFVGSQFLVPSMGDMLTRLRGRLIAEDAAILPHRFAAIGMLVGDAGLLDSVRVPERVEGLDVGAINLLALSEASFSGPLALKEPLSAPAELAAFDMLAGEAPAAAPRRVGLVATAAGDAVGVLQWIRHGFPEGTSYENSPDRACNWWPTFWPFPEPVAVSPGETLYVTVETTETEIFIDRSA